MNRWLAQSRSILVITDGVPDDAQATKEVITDASNALQQGGEVAITFVQVGDDKRAGDYLCELENNLDFKFDIVDTISYETASCLELHAVVNAAMES